MIGNEPSYGGNRRVVVPLHLGFRFRVVGSLEMLIHTRYPLDVLQKLGAKLRPDFCLNYSWYSVRKLLMAGQFYCHLKPICDFHRNCPDELLELVDDH